MKLQKPSVIAATYNAKGVPIGSYLGLIAAYGVTTILREGVIRKMNPGANPPTPTEFLLLAVGSYKLSRIVTLSSVASPIRAPFAKRGESLSAGEVQDESRGEGIQKAIGDLLTCPFCFNVWSATAVFTLFSFVPKAVLRFVTILSAAALGDFLHLAYKATRDEIT